MQHSGLCFAVSSDTMATTKGEMNEEKSAEEAIPIAADLAALIISDEAAGEEGGTKDTSAGTRGGKDEEEDEGLFMPLPLTKECPLCLVRLPFRDDEMVYHECCGNMICDGCVWKHIQVLAKRNAERALKDPPEPPLEETCAFCRKLVAKTKEENIPRIEARMAVDDPYAFEVMSGYYKEGTHGFPRDERKAFELLLRGAELGSANACFLLSRMYDESEGVEQDALKEEHYLKLAAKKGHVLARHNLGCVEWRKGNHQYAVRHWMISASAEHDKSLKVIEIAYRKKVATKDQFEGAIRAKHAAKKEMQSEERDKAKAFYGV